LSVLSVNGVLFNFVLLESNLNAKFSNPEFSITSNLTRCGASSAILVLISSRESYGKGTPNSSESALRTVQSSLPNPGGAYAALVY